MTEQMPSRKQLRDALLEAFDAAGLKRLLYFELGKDYEQIVRSGGNYRDHVIDIIQTAEQEGWVDDLIAAMKKARPKVATVQSLGGEIDGPSESSPEPPKPEPETRDINLRDQRAEDEAALGLTGRKLLVTVGIDKYDHLPKLSNAVSDAKGIHRLFTTSLGYEAPFDPLLNEDATAANINELVLEKLPEVCGADDAVVLFYAGHGETRTVQVGDAKVETGYLVPYGARARSWSRFIDLDIFLANLSMLPARHVLVILDACHSGFAIGRALTRFRGKKKYEKALLSRISRRIITSAMKDELALDGGPMPGHSLFTGTLIRCLETMATDTNERGFITTSELGLYVKETVVRHSMSQQTPDFGSFSMIDRRGELIFRTEGRGVDYQTGQETSNLVQPPRPVDRIERKAPAVIWTPARGWFEPPIPFVRVDDTTIRTTTDGQLMVLVPEGEFIYGSEDEGDGRQQRINLPSYWIDKSPVTNALYKDFLDAHPTHLMPSHWNDLNQGFEEAIAEHPVVFVELRDALAYAEWAQKSLPTEQEWEKAARGTNGRRFPWGDSPWGTRRSRNDLYCNSVDSGFDGTVPPGRFSPHGDSLYGCMDMSGNVLEWCIGSVIDHGKIIIGPLSVYTGRGGSWRLAIQDCRATRRVRISSNERRDDLGFRTILRCETGC